MNPIFDIIAPDYEDKIDAKIKNIPDIEYVPKNSYERAALFSLAYNQNDENPLLGDGLKAAIENGDRLGAWYEIRYRSNGEKLVGQDVRRNDEAALFGLYNFNQVDENWTYERGSAIDNSIPSSDEEAK